MGRRSSYSDFYGAALVQTDSDDIVVVFDHLWKTVPSYFKNVSPDIEKRCSESANNQDRFDAPKEITAFGEAWSLGKWCYKGGKFLFYRKVVEPADIGHSYNYNNGYRRRYSYGHEEPEPVEVTNYPIDVADDWEPHMREREIEHNCDRDFVTRVRHAGSLVFED
jgi:hypothetical protein